MKPATTRIVRLASRKSLARVFGVLGLVLASAAVMPSGEAAGAGRVGTVAESTITCDAMFNEMHITGSVALPAGVNAQDIAYHYWIQPVIGTASGSLVSAGPGYWTNYETVTAYRIVPSTGFIYDTWTFGSNLSGLAEGYFQVWTEVWFFDGAWYRAPAVNTHTYQQTHSFGASTRWCRTAGI